MLKRISTWTPPRGPSSALRIAILVAIATAFRSLRSEVRLFVSAHKFLKEFERGSVQSRFLKKQKTGLGEQWNRKYGRRLDLGPPE